MGDSYGDPHNNQRNHEGHRDNPRGGFRGSRGPNNRGGGREGGGFRIRLSDNEMKAARSIQEAFNLRSTVAVLGFSIRTLAQMLEEGKLDELAAQSQPEGGNSGNRRNEARTGNKRNRFEEGIHNSGKGSSKPNPFARPEKPQPSNKEDQLIVSDEEIDATKSQQDDLPISQTEDIPANENEAAQNAPDADEENSSQLSES